ncbi:MAG TPA: hypothetical protein VHC48_20465 [Puia sp.]|jgi:hypothetical protein|nr:hypothetical protein [Puia sp.]
MNLMQSFLTALLLLTSTPLLLAHKPFSFSQPVTLLTGDTTAPVGDRQASYSKNRLKINAASLFLNNYSFSYERSLTRKISFVAGYRFMPRTVLGNISVVKKVIDQVAEDGDGIKNDINRISMSNNAFTGEFRFYMGHKPGARGFYLSLYGRYAHFDLDYAYQYEAGAKTYDIPIKAATKIWGAGMMIGAQWLIARRVTLDWYIMGGHAGSIRGDASGMADLSGMSAEDKAGVKDDIESFFNVGDKKYITATVNDQGVQAKIDGPMFGLRAAGINIGIAF